MERCEKYSYLFLPYVIFFKKKFMNNLQRTSLEVKICNIKNKIINFSSSKSEPGLIMVDQTSSVKNGLDWFIMSR